MAKNAKNSFKKLTVRTKAIRFSVYFVLIALPLFLLCYFLLFMSSDFRTNADLKTDGKKVIATVTNKEWRYGVTTHRGWAPDSHVIDYYFIYKNSQGDNTRQISQNIEVSETLYNSVDKDDTIEVVYLTQDPSVNKPADEIGKASTTTKVMLIMAFGLIFFSMLSRLTRSFEKKHISRILFKFMFGIILIVAAFTLSITLTYVVLTLLF